MEFRNSKSPFSDALQVIALTLIAVCRLGESKSTHSILHNIFIIFYEYRDSIFSIFSFFFAFYERHLRHNKNSPKKPQIWTRVVHFSSTAQKSDCILCCVEWPQIYITCPIQMLRQIIIENKWHLEMKLKRGPNGFHSAHQPFVKFCRLQKSKWTTSFTTTMTTIDERNTSTH